MSAHREVLLSVDRPVVAGETTSARASWPLTRSAAAPDGLERIASMNGSAHTSVRDVCGFKSGLTRCRRPYPAVSRPLIQLFETSDDAFKIGIGAIVVLLGCRVASQRCSNRENPAGRRLHPELDGRGAAGRGPRPLVGRAGREVHDAASETAADRVRQRGKAGNVRAGTDVEDERGVHMAEQSAGSTKAPTSD